MGGRGGHARRRLRDAQGEMAQGMFGHELCDLLVLDEASQMSLPEAIMAALPLKPDAPLIVVGDHRQMPPIVKHDWETRPAEHSGSIRSTKACSIPCERRTRL